jgi:hypothetical protein
MDGFIASGSLDYLFVPMHSVSDQGRAGLRDVELVIFGDSRRYSVTSSARAMERAAFEDVPQGDINVGLPRLR